MRILNIEDTMLKHMDIARAVRKLGRVELDHAKNLKSGLTMIEASFAENRPYDVIISDMYYPADEDGVDADSGNRLIEIMKEKEANIPIIICSTVRFRIPEILGVVYYSANADWERELLELLKEVRDK